VSERNYDNFGDISSTSLSELQALLPRPRKCLLVGCLPRNMMNKLMRLNDKLLSRKRSIIETIIDQLKNISQIEHSRHRNPLNFCVNVLCGLIAYCHQPKKPSLGFEWVLPPSA
jgi:hypothetical protein